MTLRSLVIFCILSLPVVLFSQTGFFPLGDPATHINGRGIVKANDDNLIVGINNLYGTSLTKMTPEGDQIWTYQFNSISNQTFGYKIFPIPGNGYYCFTGHDYVHLSESGEHIDDNHYNISTLDYADTTYISIWFFINDIYFTGSTFDLVGTVEDFDTGMHLILFSIDLDGNILYNHMYDIYDGTRSGYHLIRRGDFDYLIYQPSTIPDATDSVQIRKINVTDFTETHCSVYPGFAPEGIIEKPDGLILYGEINKYGLDTLKETITKWNFTGDVAWSHSEEVTFGSLTGNKLSRLSELPDGNFLGLAVCETDYPEDSLFYRLQLFSPDGELISTMPVFYSVNTQIGIYAGIGDMTLFGPNSVGFAGSELMGGVYPRPFALLTDTTGNFYHVNITGRLFNDANANGIFDDGEVVFHDKLIQSEPMHFYAYSDAEGKYNLLVGKPGDYSVKTDSVMYWDIIHPADHYDVSLDTSMMYDTLPDYNFMYDYSTPVHDISVSLFQSSVSPGFEAWQSLKVENIGNQYNESGQVRINYPLELNFNYTDPVFSAQYDTIVEWNYASLNPFEPVYFDAFQTTDISAVIGEQVVTSGSVIPDIADLTSGNSDTVHLIITGSFDPNHLMVAPTGNGPTGEIDMNTEWLTYTIEFQNTGNAPAQFITIYDTLSNLTDINSLEMLSASHGYSLTILSPGILKWYFNNIMLPDSSTDFTGSQGFIKFRIKIKDEASMGDVITNTAHICFDYNMPVITNTTINTLTDFTEQINTDVCSTALHLYPVPTAKYLTIDLTRPDNKASSVYISDINGIVISKIPMATGVNSITIDISDLPTGNYFCSLQETNGAEISTTQFQVIR